MPSLQWKACFDPMLEMTNKKNKKNRWTQNLQQHFFTFRHGKLIFKSWENYISMILFMKEFSITGALWQSKMFFVLFLADETSFVVTFSRLYTNWMSSYFMKTLKQWVCVILCWCHYWRFRGNGLTCFRTISIVHLSANVCIYKTNLQ